MEASGSVPTRRVVVAEANLPVRQELCELLGLIGGVEVVGRAANVDEAVHLASALEPDVVILDFEKSDTDGCAAAAIIRDRLPGVLLVALTIHELEDVSGVARRTGFDCFFAMDTPSSTLLEVIRGALSRTESSNCLPGRVGSSANS